MDDDLDERLLDTENSTGSPELSHGEEKVLNNQEGVICCDFPNCSRTFKKPSLLYQHRTVHTGERPFTCEECGKTFIRPYHMKRHKLSVHAKESMFKCPYESCSYVCNIKHNLNRHVKRNHEKELPFKCAMEGCNEEFKKHRSLEIHEINAHNGELYQCPHEGCDKKYQTSAKLKRHSNVHKKQKAYFCKNENCNAMFYTWSELRKHIFTCKVHQCQECGKIFKKAYILKNHSQVHDKERTLFKCPVEGCNREYTRRSNVVMHLRVSHESGNTFQCPQENCHQTFAYKVSLKKHLENHEKIVKMYENIAKNKKKMEKKRRKQKRLRTSTVSKISGFVHELDKLVNESDLENQYKDPDDITGTATEDETEAVNHKLKDEQEEQSSITQNCESRKKEMVPMNESLHVKHKTDICYNSSCTANSIVCC